VFGDSELLDTVWVGTQPRSCILVVLLHIAKVEENKEGGNKVLNKSVHAEIFTDLLSLEVSQSTLILGYGLVLYNAVL